MRMGERRSAKEMKKKEARKRMRARKIVQKRMVMKVQFRKILKIRGYVNWRIKSTRRKSM